MVPDWVLISELNVFFTKCRFDVKRGHGFQSNRLDGCYVNVRVSVLIPENMLFSDKLTNLLSG